MKPHYRPDYTLSPVEAAYIAGFFDGEGMVAISKHRQRKKSGILVNHTYTLIVQFSQSSLPVLHWISHLCGGWTIQKCHERSHCRIHWKLTMKGHRAVRILEQLLPYLIVKHEEAIHGIRFQELQSDHKNRYEAGREGPVPRTSEEIAYKEYYFRLLKNLKKPVTSLD